MNKIIIHTDVLKEQNISINEYLILYNLYNDHSISDVFNYNTEELISLQQKGFIKLIIDQDILLRQKAIDIFQSDDDIFALWLKEYPNSVKKKTSFGSRALSPNSRDTFAGKKLEEKWNRIFKKDLKAQKHALSVLKAEVKSRTKSGDLEFMVAAERWLNGGYWELGEHYLEEDNDIEYLNEDYE